MKKVIVGIISLVLFLFSFNYPIYATNKNVFLKNTSAYKKVALTFDDGPHPIYTPRILNILEEYNIKATFFVIGQNIEYYPDAFQKILSSNSEIGNHTFHHKNISKLCERDILNEFELTEKVLLKQSNKKISIFRPPEGSYSSALERVANGKGYDIILWSIDTRDWAHTSASLIAKNVLNKIGNGDIILMHDYISGGSPTCEALNIIIPELQKRGYEFVTVSELIHGE